MEKFILDTCTWIEFSHERNGVKEKVERLSPNNLTKSEIDGWIMRDEIGDIIKKSI